MRRGLSRRGASATGLIISLMLMVAAWFIGPELIKLVSSEGAYRDAGTRYFRFCCSPCRGL